MSTDYTPINNPRTWEKFDERGRAKLHRGSTIVSRLRPGCEVFHLGQRIQDDLARTELADQFALTPPNSFHMTVYEGLKNRAYIGQEEIYPGWLVSSDFPDIVHELRQRLVEADIPPAPELRMRVVGVRPVAEALTLVVEPQDEQMRDDLIQFRANIAEVWGLPVRSLNEYFFHITLGYRLSDPRDTQELNEELTEKYASWATGVPELERPALTIFDDMLAFPPIHYL
ncbi:DUF1868 domain-containing protein [Corynebacterium massiliense]|uniref:DUF1868 domain-containing protein n=1 Tax=Corynebacterium massiliense DSM 45435 TaxID=1121364 RepID=A0ABY7U698_9CORY|nr:DUF1868 domain-containing protein [Corynebacterium massiliense]WCZ31514.1 hypothetical protein CMASS_00210 [Corynebacterium massiliense DSM 45435]